MNIEYAVEQIHKTIEQLQGRIYWLEKNKERLSDLPEGQFFGQVCFDFDNLSHEQVIEVIKAIGGKWEKELSSGTGDRINYKGELHGQVVRCYAGGPPPNCKVVEWAEEVPAQTIMRRKLVCAGVEHETGAPL